MNLDGILAIMVIAMVPAAIASTVILYLAARVYPRVGALTDRTFIAADICLMLLSGAVLTFNRLSGFSLFPLEVARILFSTSLIVLGLVPIAWLVLWYRGKLG